MHKEQIEGISTKPMLQLVDVHSSLHAAMTRSRLPLSRSLLYSPSVHHKVSCIANPLAPWPCAVGMPHDPMSRLIFRCWRWLHEGWVSIHLDLPRPPSMAGPDSIGRCRRYRSAPVENCIVKNKATAFYMPISPFYSDATAHTWSCSTTLKTREATLPPDGGR